MWGLCRSLTCAVCRRHSTGTRRRSGMTTVGVALHGREAPGRQSCTEEMAAQHQTDDPGAAGPGPEEGLASERELWRRFSRNRDQVAREELVRRNMAFAKRLALRYRGASESLDDL